MIRAWIVLTMTAAAWLPAAALGPATRSASAPSARPKRSLEDYRLIVDRNIFSRDRTRRTVAARPSREPAATQPVEQRHLVLTGVALQGEAPMAFFEDSLDGQTLWVRTGMPIGHGVVRDISFEGVTYRNGAGERIIAIGEDIEGVAVTLQASTTQGASAATDAGAPAAGAAAPAGNADDVLQRMRLRRLQELK